ncbi:iron hydrogenase, partial [Radiomyces spectabilis]|uniref:iron hydrogenase n=1 Tax=Radiomyces spectabilis TaxID=64574 RepID=UPI00221E99DE
SGCVTSAESVLVSMQSKEEVYDVLNANKLAAQENRINDQRMVVVSISPQSRASLAAKYNLTPLQVHRRLIYFFKHHLGVHRVFDIAFTQDLSLVESAREFLDRFRQYMANGGDKMEAAMQQQDAEKAAEEAAADDTKPRARARRRRAGKPENGDGNATQSFMPMLASSCPGWVCYAEKTHGEVLPHITAAKSPQQMMGSLVKDYFAGKMNLLPNQIYHVSIMPCFDKKLEASRPDFHLEQYNTREVDCVLTTGEVDAMIQEQNVDFRSLPEASVDDMFNKVMADPATQLETAYGMPGSSSGGALEYILGRAASELFGIHDVPADPSVSPGRIIVKTGKNADVREYMLQGDDGRVLLRFATAYGFRNIQNIVRKIKTGKCQYHYVEVMACPGGCVNGGGQLPPPSGVETETIINAKDWVAHVESIYRSVQGVQPEENETIKSLYNEWIGDPSTPRATQLLRTQYHAVTQNLVNPLATKW